MEYEEARSRRTRRRSRSGSRRARRCTRADEGCADEGLPARSATGGRYQTVLTRLRELEQGRAAEAPSKPDDPHFQAAPKGAGVRAPAPRRLRLDAAEVVAPQDRSVVTSATAAKPTAAQNARLKPSVSACGSATPSSRRFSVRVVETVVRIARPSAPPICWVVLMRPEASPASLPGSRRARRSRRARTRSRGRRRSG